MEKAIKSMPLCTFTAEGFTEGEKECTMSDAITLSFGFKYDNLEEKETPGYLHSLRYPFLKKTGWNVIIADGQTKEKVIMNEKVYAKDGNSGKFEMK